MDRETKRAFDNVMLGICAIETMVASLMLNDAARDEDWARAETIRETMKQIEKASERFRGRIKKG